MPELIRTVRGVGYLMPRTGGSAPLEHPGFRACRCGGVLRR
jgi:hypothetical protein